MSGAARHVIPRRLDDPERWLFWTLDEAAALMGPAVLGLAANQFVMGLVAGAGGSVVLGRNIPGARTEIVQDAGHGVYRDKREVFRPLLLEFLADNGLLSN